MPRGTQLRGIQLRGGRVRTASLQAPGLSSRLVPSFAAGTVSKDTGLDIPPLHAPTPEPAPEPAQPPVTLLETLGCDHLRPSTLRYCWHLPQVSSSLPRPHPSALHAPMAASLHQPRPVSSPSSCRRTRPFPPCAVLFSWKSCRLAHDPLDFRGFSNIPKVWVTPGKSRLSDPRFPHL